MEHSDERRSHIRVPFGGTVQVIQHDEPLPPCACFDIGEGGMRVAADLPREAPVEVLFAVPCAEEICCVILIRAEVAWGKGWCTGVRFLHSSDEVRDRIRAFVEAKA